MEAGIVAAMNNATTQFTAVTTTTFVPDKCCMCYDVLQYDNLIRTYPCNCTYCSDCFIIYTLKFRMIRTFNCCTCNVPINSIYSSKKEYYCSTKPWITNVNVTVTKTNNNNNNNNKKKNMNTKKKQTLTATDDCAKEVVTIQNKNDNNNNKKENNNSKNNLSKPKRSLKRLPISSSVPFAAVPDNDSCSDNEDVVVDVGKISSELDKDKNKVNRGIRNNATVDKTPDDKNNENVSKSFNVPVSSSTDGDDNDNCRDNEDGSKNNENSSIVVGKSGIHDNDTGKDVNRGNAATIDRTTSDNNENESKASNVSTNNDDDDDDDNDSNVNDSTKLSAKRKRSDASNDSTSRKKKSASETNDDINEPNNDNQNKRRWRDKSTDDYIEEIKAYKEKNGHFEFSWRKDRNLAYFAFRIRNGERELTTEQRQILDDIGFQWIVEKKKPPKRGKHDKKTFEDRIQQLEDYKKVHGHCRVPHRDKLIPGLGEWVKDVRRGHIKTNDERMNELNRIGFYWETKYDRLERIWNEKFNELIQYKNINGHTIIPRNNNYMKLYEWCCTQRSSYNKNQLRNDRKNKLLDINFSFNTKNNNNNTEKNSNNENNDIVLNNNIDNDQEDTKGDNENNDSDTTVSVNSNNNDDQDSITKTIVDNGEIDNDNDSY